MQRWLTTHSAWCVGDATAWVLFGSCGEGPSFSIAERLAAAEAVLRAGVDPARLGMGTGCPAIADTVALTKGMLSLGITRTLLLPPYYFAGMSAEGIEDAFAAVLDGVADARLSACLYHIPQVCGVPVPAAVLGRLRTRYGATVSGVKDSSGDFEAFLGFRAAAPDVAALVGAEVLIGRAVAAGGPGDDLRHGEPRACTGTPAVPRARRAAGHRTGMRADRQHPHAEGGIGGGHRRTDLAQRPPAAAGHRRGHRCAHRRNARINGATTGGVTRRKT